MRTRKRQRIKIAPATMNQREVMKIADEILRPLNQGLITVGSAVNFRDYVESEYITGSLPLLASTTRACYQGAIRKRLEPSFGLLCLRDLTPRTLKQFFAGMAGDGVAYPSIVKTRDALSSILRAAIEDELLIKNPMEGLRLPPDKRPRRAKPFISPEQFSSLIELIPEPYATAVYVCVWTGLRVSELLGLKWRCIHADSLSVEQRYCRGDWAAPKTEASAAPIAVEPQVLARIHRLKSLTVDVRAGRGVRHFKVVKAEGPDDLVFQSVKDGKPMSDGNILKRFIKPAAKKLGLRVNWRCLRTSHATWLVQAGADPKSVQGQMRHTRISTTMDIYAQIVPAAQRRALEKLTEFAKSSVPKSVPLLVQ
ncbi:MAG TPA: tyrosine-type recombinase/integrase [Candidatus Sulfotelmatobacter sp.]|nr:tyrosine-type recombinase/integrase [Candidatus Sulfotelmatobacter sp.]